MAFMSCSQDTLDANTEQDNMLKQAVRASSPNGQLEHFILPNESDLDQIPQDKVLNPLTQAKVDLGKFLFFETGIALDAFNPQGMGTYSCASCHIPSAGFRPGTFQGIADGGAGFGVNGEDRGIMSGYEEDDMDTQDARALSLLNVAYVENTFWNGQFGAGGVNIGTEDVWTHDNGSHVNELTVNGQHYQAIEAQNIEGVETHRMLMNKKIADSLGFTTMFDASFPEFDIEERYSKLTLSLALSAYIRTLLSNQAPFQSWLKGNYSALSSAEKQGGMLFFGKANCSTCHYNKNLGSKEFHALGVNDMYHRPSFSSSKEDFRNQGRGGFTGKEEDMFKFKVPQLYNMSDTPFYFHGSSIESLTDLVEYKNDAVKENENVPDGQMSEKFKSLNLTVEEKNNLVQFLEKSLYDPNLTRYQPENLMSGGCFPNADPQSMQDLGCR